MLNRGCSSQSAGLSHKLELESTRWETRVNSCTTLRRDECVPSTGREMEVMQEFGETVAVVTTSRLTLRQRSWTSSPRPHIFGLTDKVRDSSSPA